MTKKEAGENKWKVVTLLSVVMLVAGSSTIVTASPAEDLPVVTGDEDDGFQGLAVMLDGHAAGRDMHGQTFTVPRCQYFSDDGGFRESLLVGFSNFGTFNNPDTASGAGEGFQMPMGRMFESLAVGFWGEGWLFDFGFGERIHQFHLQVGEYEAVHDYYTESDRYIRYVATVFMPLFGGDDGVEGTHREGLLVDFQFVIDKEVCDVVLRTTVENQSFRDLSVQYERNVDWDVWMPDQGSFTNCFQNFPGGARAFLPLGFATSSSCHSAFSDQDERVECRNTVHGLGTMMSADLFAWDDLTEFGPGSNHLISYGVPLAIDGNLGFHWERAMDPNDVWSTFLRYECTAYPLPVPPPDLPLPEM